jgi:hypothetical protein
MTWTDSGGPTNSHRCQLPDETTITAPDQDGRRFQCSECGSIWVLIDNVDGSSAYVWGLAG